MKLTGAQILWEALVREGVTDVFGYPGGAILPAYDAMLQYPISPFTAIREMRRGPDGGDIPGLGASLVDRHRARFLSPNDLRTQFIADLMR